MKLDTVIAERIHKKIYRDGSFAIKVFDETFPKSDILNEALNQSRIEETGLNVPKIVEVAKIDENGLLSLILLKVKPCSRLWTKTRIKRIAFGTVFGHSAGNTLQALSSSKQNPR